MRHPGNVGASREAAGRAAEKLIEALTLENPEGSLRRLLNRGWQPVFDVPCRRFTRGGA